jgi:hypothetical protein
MTIKEQIEDFAFQNELDVKFIQPYHIRLMKDNYTSVDIFPNSLRVFFLGTKDWVSNENLDMAFERILNHFTLPY